MSSPSQRPTGAGTPPAFRRNVLRWLMSSALAGTALAPQAASKPSRPYLATIAPVPLRYSPPPPDLSTDPAPAAPPAPDGIIGEVAQSNLEAVVPDLLPSDEPVPDSVDLGPDATLAPPLVVATEPLAPAPSPRPPVSLIPDDLMPPRTMQEEVLPYFLPPLIPSAPASRATYQLK